MNDDLPSACDRCIEELEAALRGDGGSSCWNRHCELVLQELRELRAQLETEGKRQNDRELHQRITKTLERVGWVILARLLDD